ncbi:pentatricopeptide repeat-containing protein [Striga asiatica]|uniref:Pentatricopeptide repeat-containing protein n=1 Tax=Striga asiatica TaxID=4170 RepID=A0A5A7PTZ6_STRAF|nr:pentatricopeptide repeat-containing protein [Striga asiatica]
MRRSPANELASVISRALLAASSHQTPPGRSWTPSLEQTLHHLGCRDSLSPALVARVIDPFLLNHHSLALGFFNWASQQPGFSHAAASYQSVIRSLSASRQFTSVDKILRQARAQKVLLHPSAYRSVISSLLSGRRTQMAFSVFCQVHSVLPEIGPEACNSLLAALSVEGSTKNARKVFDEMTKCGVRLSTLGFGVFLWRACGKMALIEVLNLVDEVRRVEFTGIDGSIVALMVVHGLCAEARTEDAAFALEELRKRDWKPDFMAYRVVAEKLRDIKSVVDVEIMLKKKRKLGVAPRTSAYREIICRLVSEKLMHEAKELGEVIMDGNFPIEADVLNVLIGSVSATDPLKAVSFFRFMLEKEQLPTLLTLINLCENLCKHEKGDEVVEIFQLLSAKEYFTNLETYNVMISFLCKVGRVKECYHVFGEMKKKGVDPNVLSYNFLLEACCREDLVRPAKRLWDEMFASGCCGNLESYNILIAKLSELGQVEDSCRLFHHMLEKGLKPNELTYKSILEGLCRAKNVEIALQIFNKSVEQDAKLSVALLQTFVVCLCREGYFEKASELLRGPACGVGFLEPHLMFLRCLVDIGQLSLATEHVEWVSGKSPALMHAIQSESPALFSIVLNSQKQLTGV